MCIGIVKGMGIIKFEIWLNSCLGALLALTFLKG